MLDLQTLLSELESHEQSRRQCPPIQLPLAIAKNPRGFLAIANFSLCINNFFVLREGEDRSIPSDRED